MKKVLLALIFIGLTAMGTGCGEGGEMDTEGFEAVQNTMEDPQPQAAEPTDNGGSYNDGTGGVWIPGEGVLTTGDSGVTF